MTDISFYTNPMSRGQIARWALEEVGADYTQHLLFYGKRDAGGMKSPDYLAINPMGKVPAIVDHRYGDAVITEAAAICHYLAESYPDAGLLPTAAERAPYFRWLFFAAGPLEAAVTARSMGWGTDDPQKQGMLGFGDFDRARAVLIDAVSQSAYIAGDRFTMADVYVGSQVQWGLMFGSIPADPALDAYAKRLEARPAWIKAKGIDGALIAAAAAEQAQG